MRRLHQGPYAKTDGYWIGVLASTLAMNAKDPEPRAMRRVLRDFLASPIPSEHLRKTIRGYLR